MNEGDRFLPVKTSDGIAHAMGKLTAPTSTGDRFIVVRSADGTPMAVKCVAVDASGQRGIPVMLADGKVGLVRFAPDPGVYVGGIKLFIIFSPDGEVVFNDSDEKDTHAIYWAVQNEWAHRKVGSQSSYFDEDNGEWVDTGNLAGYSARNSELGPAGQNDVQPIYSIPGGTLYNAYSTVIQAIDFCLYQDRVLYVILPGSEVDLEGYDQYESNGVYHIGQGDPTLFYDPSSPEGLAKALIGKNGGGFFIIAENGVVGLPALSYPLQTIIGKSESCVDSSNNLYIPVDDGEGRIAIHKSGWIYSEKMPNIGGQHVLTQAMTTTANGNSVYVISKQKDGTGWNYLKLNQDDMSWEIWGGGSGTTPRPLVIEVPDSIRRNILFSFPTIHKCFRRTIADGGYGGGYGNWTNATPATGSINAIRTEGSSVGSGYTNYRIIVPYVCDEDCSDVACPGTTGTYSADVYRTSKPPATEIPPPPDGWYYEVVWDGYWMYDPYWDEWWWSGLENWWVDCASVHDQVTPAQEPYFPALDAGWEMIFRQEYPDGTIYEDYRRVDTGIQIPFGSSPPPHS